MKSSSKKKLGQTIRDNLLLPRPPIVAVLGHIDHGKTTLLDKIRQSNLASKESGGITQHIGAYQIKHQGKLITFIDTPGHAAFSKMRSRGSKVADIVVLVVAADEGFKAQTKESLEHIQAAGIPYLVAINKIDLSRVDLKKVYQDLAKNGVVVEKEGGEIVSVPVSAKTGEGIKELLEMILLLAEMADLKGKPQGKLEGTIIESKLDRSRGPLATVLIRDGSLKKGDQVAVNDLKVKVRALLDENNQLIDVVGPGRPAEVLGFKQVPPVGAKVTDLVVEKEREKSDKQVESSSNLGALKKSHFPTDETEGKDKKLKIILKTDVQGTLEAIIKSLPENVVVIDKGVGDLGESDVLLADATGAEVVGFRVKIPSGVKKLAETEKVNLKIYQNIYDLLDDIEVKVLKLMEPTIDEEVLGQAEIVAEFEIKKQRVAGCRVTEGKITKRDRLHLKRDTRAIGDCRIKSIKQGKEVISQAEKGEEFGVILEPSLDFAIGDVLISYRPNNGEN